MAPELRKRKSKPVVAEPEPVAKKSKATKTPKAEKRKAPEDASPVAVKKQKPTKDVASKKAAAPAEKAAPKKSALKKEKQSPKTKAATEKSKKEEPEEEQDGDVPSDAEEEVDDDTNALVQALDSGDEDETEAQVSTFKKGQDVGKAPKAKKSTKAPATSSSGTPGVMYLARIPHGFYEHELRSYFGQFGDITRLRVVRNKKTGASRHRAFIEFADAEVADIAARTMDKYLLFGHILSAKTVPPAQVHPDLFKGANRRFKVVPWNQMAGKQLERPLSESQWQVKISKEEQRRAARSEKLKEMGYEFEAPALKAAEAKPLLENGTEEEPKTIEAAPAAETAEPKEEEEVAEAEVVQAKATKSSEEATPQKKKGKKGKKTKS